MDREEESYHIWLYGFLRFLNPYKRQMIGHVSFILPAVTMGCSCEFSRYEGVDKLLGMQDTERWVGAMN